MKPERFNSGRQAIRRYRHPSGAIVIVRADRRASVIPASMPCGVVVDVTRATAAELILDARRHTQGVI